MRNHQKSTIRHISIDFWSTLYKPNPKFSEERISYLQGFFPNLDIDRTIWTNAIVEIGKSYDALVEQYGISHVQKELYNQLFFKIGVHVNQNQLQTICSDLEQLFFEQKPFLIDPEYVFLLNRLSDKKLTISISSNTAFVSGKSLKRCIDQDQISDQFSFMIFSDEVGYSKPSPHFYSEVFSRVNLLHGGSLVQEQILHVGDNQLTDIMGAGAFGFGTLHIASSQDLFKIEEYV